MHLHYFLTFFDDAKVIYQKEKMLKKKKQFCNVGNFFRTLSSKIFPEFPGIPGKFNSRFPGFPGSEKAREILISIFN